mgnify:CR=1 FL=1
MRSVCFTGHRKITITRELKTRLYTELELLVHNGVTDFYAGGALGFDTLAEQTVIELKGRYPQIRLNLGLPCPAEQQTRKWNVTDKTEYFRITDVADSVEVCSEQYTYNCMRNRNQRLVDLADICVCYYNPSKERSGTGQTVRIAQKKGLPIINVFDW